MTGSIVQSAADSTNRKTGSGCHRVLLSGLVALRLDEKENVGRRVPTDEPGATNGGIGLEFTDLRQALGRGWIAALIRSPHLDLLKDEHRERARDVGAGPN